MSALSDFLGSLSSTVKAVSALAAAFSVGVAFTLTLSGYTSIPAAMEAHEVAIEANTVAIEVIQEWKETHSQEYSDIICLNLLSDEDVARLRSMTPFQQAFEIRRLCP